VPTRESFNDFLKRRAKASEDFMIGKPDLMMAMSTQQDPATFFPVAGTAISGAERVNDSHRQSARQFSPGSIGRLEILQSGSDVEMGFWAGILHAEVIFKGQDEKRPLKLRITEVFRRSEEGWKLVHRHADIMKE
jgi:ketosteroid isomerase-like protein